LSFTGLGIDNDFGVNFSEDWDCEGCINMDLVSVSIYLDNSINVVEWLELGSVECV
jgi:hypothetical protein